MSEIIPGKPCADGALPVLTDAPRFGEWRDISTAPTMEAVLVFGGEAKYPVVASWTGMPDEAWTLDALGVTHDEIDCPTHWMPLPADPDDGVSRDATKANSGIDQ